MRHVWLILMVLMLASCGREKRQFQVPPPLAENLKTWQLTDLVAASPAAHAGAPAPGFFFSAYQKNAYQMGEGQKLYENFNCVTCHAHGGGDIGPPLNDDQWIYGSQPQQIFASIVQGRPRGMPAFGPRLNQNQVWQLVAYVRSLSGLAPKNAAPGRDDHLQVVPEAPNSTPAPQPKNVSPP